MFSFDDPQLRKVLTVVAAAGAAALTFVAPAGTGLSPTGVAVAQPGGGTDAPGVDNRLGGDVRDQI
ncbi:hypothetical protein, partial [Mycobacterium sp. E740]|uniref:hypothetical protein n=1 Tax=Mycobacterium sp. E740 TaxID=1834149 RepID=UPI000A93B6E3